MSPYFCYNLQKCQTFYPDLLSLISANTFKECLDTTNDLSAFQRSSVLNHMGAKTEAAAAVKLAAKATTLPAAIAPSLLGATHSVRRPRGAHTQTSVWREDNDSQCFVGIRIKFRFLKKEECFRTNGRELTP